MLSVLSLHSAHFEFRCILLSLFPSHAILLQCSDPCTLSGDPLDQGIPCWGIPLDQGIPCWGIF